MTMSLGVKLAAFMSFTSIRPSEGGREEGGREREARWKGGLMSEHF